LAGDANHFALAADELAVGYARQAPLARLALEVARGAALFRLAAIHGSRPTGAALLRPLLRRARRCLVG
ncbi:MAG: hypothetical protein ACE5ID_04425, partial [Acidobacteriota bacterium]